MAGSYTQETEKQPRREMIPQACVGKQGKGQSEAVVKNPAVVKNRPADAGGTGDAGSIPEWERAPGVGNGNRLQYSCLENSMNREEPGRLQSLGSQKVRHN